MCMLTQSSSIISITGFFFFFYVICKYTVLEVTTQDSSTVMIHRYHIIWNDNKKKWHIHVYNCIQLQLISS